MKSPWWPAVVVVWCGLTLPGTLAPATFYIKHVSDDGKDDFPPSTTPSTAISQIRFYSNHKGDPKFQSRSQSRLYPGTTYSEDFGTYPGDNSLTTGFVDEINDFHIPQGAVPTQLDKSNEDYPTAGYNLESGEPPDYQTFYSSDEEGPPPPPPPEEHRDYSEDEDLSSPQNYEVEEKIPDDLKYKPPKVTVYPLPPPCKGATPPPWPTPPPPPKPTPKPKPKPKPKPGGGSTTGQGGYYVFSTNPRLRKPTRASAKYRSSTSKYRSKPKTTRSKIVYKPYLIRYSNLPARPILIRQRTVRPVKMPSRTSSSYRAPSSYKKPTKPTEIVKEVHIHHHHEPSHIAPLPALVPLIPLYDENGIPLHRSDGKKPYLVSGMSPSGSDNVDTIAMPPSDNVNAVEVQHNSADQLGRFAEPPPHTTSSYRETDPNNGSGFTSQSTVEITG